LRVGKTLQRLTKSARICVTRPSITPKMQPITL
jgi:hypothetical protein